MSSTASNGRLGNHIFRNLAVNLIAKKHNLYVTYTSHDRIEMLGIQLFVGINKFPTSMSLTDDTYFETLNAPEISTNINTDSYFQTHEISALIYNYLHETDVMSQIIEHNPFKERYQHNNDLYVHIRLGDVSHLNPGLAYYVNAIQDISHNTLYISTDSPRHAIIKQIHATFPKTQLVQHNEIKTFQFGSTCRHVLLSHGSFSAIIGYLAFFSDVYYPEYPSHMWHGDMFSIDGWTKLTLEN
jgi:hypothetical protein